MGKPSQKAEHPNRDTLLKWASENERYAAEMREIAFTDPARKQPALAAARIHQKRAEEYRQAVKNYQS